MNAAGDPGGEEDARLERMIGDALRGEPLDELRLARMRSTVHGEWRATIAAQGQVRRRPWVGVAAAAVLLAAIVVGWLAMRPAEVFGVLQGPLADSGLADARLRVGARFQVRSSLLVALQAGGLLRAQPGSELALESAGEVRLLRGTVFLDAQGRAPSMALRVDTPAGVVRHLGTQFEVAIVDDKVRVRVREGSVSVRGDLRVGEGEQLTLGPGGEARREPFATYDSGWRWVESPLADVPVDGRSLAFLLQWVARDTGRKLEFSDERSATLAGETILHGSVTGLAPELALRAMLATTSLEADIRADRIVVRARAQATRG